MNPDSKIGRTGKDPFRFGLHVSAAGGLERIFGRGEALGVNAVQIFSHSSRSWEFDLPPDETLAVYHREREASSVSRVFIHASYLINIASEDPAVAEKSRITLRKELQTADLLGAEGLVLHPGSARGGNRSSAIARAAGILREVLDSLPGLRTPLLLENTAGAGSMLGSRPEEMAMIIKAIDRPDHLGLCLDSCHLFAAGFDLSTREGLERVVEDFLAGTLSGQLSLWHLNDALFGLGSGRDRHAGLGEGHIGTPALSRIVRMAISTGVPLILETPKGEGETLDRLNLRSLHSFAGLPLPELLRDAG